jgi:hypothetical protein
MSEGHINGNTYEAPHCDNLVLHAPEDNCIYCNAFPKKQQERIDNKINFTGHHDPDKSTCPAELRRSAGTINKWHGNIAVTPEIKEEQDKYWKKVQTLWKIGVFEEK